MPNKKISELPTATSIDGTEIYEIVQGGVNKKVSQSLNNPFRGSWAGTTTLPNTGGRYSGGVPAAGDFYRFENEVDISGNIYSAGTIALSLVNTPGQTLSNWAFLSVQL